MTLRIAAVQMEAVPGEMSSNLHAVVAWVRRASESAARLVVFPETATTGYDLDVFASGLPSGDDLSWLDLLQSAVDETGVVVVLNTALRTGGTARLSQVLLTPSTRAMEVYAKQHLYPLERDLFEPGESGTTITVDGVQVALSVCYDANFPEHAAAAARDGALVYLNSGAYFPGGAHRRDLHYASRALDNGMYVVFSGLIGRPHDFIGGTAAYDPLGQTIDRLESGDGMVLVDVDPAVVDAARESQQMWRDRRIELGERAVHVV